MHAVRLMSDVGPLLPALMPELLRRMGHLPVLEQAVSDDTESLCCGDLSCAGVSSE